MPKIKMRSPVDSIEIGKAFDEFVLSQTAKGVKEVTLNTYHYHFRSMSVYMSILYVAIMENHHTKVLQSELLDQYSTDIFPKLFPEEEALNGIIRVYPMTDSMLYHDYQQEKTLLLL